MEGNPPAIHQAFSALHIMSSCRMLKRFKTKIVLFIPLAGLDVQGIHLACRLSRRGGKALGQALPQQFSEEVVITIPPSLVVQRDDKQVCVVKIVQGSLPR